MPKFGLTERKERQLQERMEACGLLESDLEESFVRSSGPGGQRVNKTSSCVYLLHRPSGLEVKTQKERSQRLNRFYARRRMCELLEEKILGEKSPKAVKDAKLKKQKDRRRRRQKIESKQIDDSGD